jgi:hypothetical protein
MGLPTNASVATSALCSTVANGTSPTAGTSYELRDCSAAPVADYAEMYPVEKGIEYGDIVATGSDIVNTYDIGIDGGVDWNKVKSNISKLTKSDTPYQKNVIGIVSDNHSDFTSAGYNIKQEDNPMPVALNGRVPVKVSPSSSPIQVGDYITTSADGGMAMRALKSGFMIGKALESWDRASGKNTVMVFIEQGYYDGPEYNEHTWKGLTFFEGDTEFVKNVEFKSQVTFDVPPLFNNDTAGFAVVKRDTEVVEIKFSTPYISTPVVSTTITFDKEKVSEGAEPKSFDAQNFFNQDLKFVVADKDENGFKIILNKKPTQDIKFSWTAFAVKDPKIFESVIEGLVIEQGTNIQSVTPSTQIVDTTIVTPQSQVANVVNAGNEVSTGTGSSTSIINSIINTDLIQGLIGGGSTPASTPEVTPTPASTSAEVAPVVEQAPVEIIQIPSVESPVPVADSTSAPL